MARRKKKQQVEEDTDFGPAPVAPVEDQSRLTPLDVQQKVFRIAFRGYHEQDVDQFLDQVTEDLAALHEENKRLREELELRGSPAGFEDAKRHAEETVRRAREEAARIRAEADRRASTAAGDAGSGPAPPTFLVRERDFLQELASLVQRHAEALKKEARRTREEQEAREPDPEREPEPEREPDPEPRPPLSEQTAPTAAAEAPSENEGLLREWSSAFEDDQGPEAPWSEERPGSDWVQVPEEPSPPSAEGPVYEDQGEEQEPSLRELFWGEE